MVQYCLGNSCGIWTSLCILYSTENSCGTSLCLDTRVVLCKEPGTMVQFVWSCSYVVLYREGIMDQFVCIYTYICGTV